MRLKYVGSHDEVELPGGQTVKRGATTDVADALAGTPPAARLAVAMSELHAAASAFDHDKARTLRAEIAGLDYGSGLLAQSDSWQVATAKKDEVPA